MSNKSLRAALKTVKTYGNQINAEAKADYKVAMSATGAGQRNLMKQTRALTREALGTYSKTNQRLAGLGDRATQFRSQEKRAEDRVTRQYGSALSGSVQQSYSTARTAEAGTGKLQKATLRQGLAGAKTAASAMKIAKQGVRAGKQASAYELAQALQQRYIANNSDIAQMTSALYQAELQAQASFDLWKKQQQYTAKQTEKTQLAGLEGVADDLTPAVYDAMQKYVANGKDVSLETATKNIAEQYSIAQGTDEYAFLQKAISVMRTQGSSPADALYSIFQNAYSGAHGWDKIAQPLQDQITAGQYARQDYWVAHQTEEPYSGYFNQGGSDSTSSQTYTAPSGNQSFGTRQTSSGTQQVAFAYDGRQVDLAGEKLLPPGSQIPEGYSMTRNTAEGVYVAPVV